MNRKSAIVFVMLFILILGCNSEEQASLQENETPTVLENISQETPESSSDIDLPAGECLVGWKCISSTVKAYREPDCSFGERVQCPLGCFNDTCRAASTCTSGFKCINDHRKGYQTEACTWINDVECPGGCEEGECLFYNASAMEITPEPEVEEEPAAPVDNSRTLRMGQQETIDIGDEDRVISIYILEQSKVKFSVDGFKTDWMEEGDTVLIRGLTITVKEILFQSFSGGKQEVRYTVE
ncbi:MAG TPA: hypothetical protein VJI32_03945 [Candidatus Nanoarchaeia archaeon]|nr:hypothetical protein [Candidatus Nanoarchaeia archaeon]